MLKFKKINAFSYFTRYLENYFGLRGFLYRIYFHRTHCSINPVLRFTTGFITTLCHRFIANWCSQCSSKWYGEGKVTIWLHCLTIVWLSHFLYLISPLMRLHCLHIAFTLPSHEIDCSFTSREILCIYSSRMPWLRLLFDLWTSFE